MSGLIRHGFRWSFGILVPAMVLVPIVAAGGFVRSASGSLVPIAGDLPEVVVTGAFKTPAAMEPSVSRIQPLGDPRILPIQSVPETSSAEVRISDFSGLPVPRYATMRYDQVNGRSGPSTDYPVRWVYERRGLPVVIVRESQDWRMVRDPMGDAVWVNRTQLSEERNVMTTTAGQLYRDRGAQPFATYEPGAVMQFSECIDGEWCRVSANGVEAWIRRTDLWGADVLGSAPG